MKFIYTINISYIYLNIPIYISDDNENVKTSNDSTSNKSNDPGTWTEFSEEDRNFWLQKGSQFFQNENCDFSDTAKSYRETDGKEKIRHLTKAVFVRSLPNKEKVNRSWLIYSPLKKTLYCFACRLFSKTITAFASAEGYNDWKHVSQAAKEHENGQVHRECMITLTARSKQLGRIDTELISQYQSEVSY